VRLDCSPCSRSPSLLQFQLKVDLEGRERASSHALEIANLKAEISRLTAAKSAAETMASSHLERVHVSAVISKALQTGWVWV